MPIDYELIKGADNGNPPDSLREMYPKVNRNFNKTDQAIDELGDRVDTIIQGGGPDKDAELVDIRTPASEYTPLAPITTAGGMTRDMQEQFMSHKADVVQEFIDVNKKLSYRDKQVVSYASLLKKITEGTAIKVVCQGDSMTYGQDTVSGDKRPAMSDPTLDTSETRVQEQAGKTYPEALQEICNSTFGAGKVTVVNRGFSGDWVERSMTRWTVDPEADLHFIMLGTIDSATYPEIPVDVRQVITKYVTDMSKLVEQILDWGSAVVLLTPPKQSLDGSLILQMFRRALRGVGAKYDIPVIDSQDFLQAYPYSSVQSDGVHYNTEGYTSFGAKVAGVLASISSVYSPLRIHHMKTILPAQDDYGIAIRNGAVLGFEEHTIAPLGVGANANTGLMFKINAGTKYAFSFYAEEDNLVVTPIFNIASASTHLKFQLDFGIDPGSYVSPYPFGESSRGSISALVPKKEILYTTTLNRTNIYLEPANDVMDNSFHLPRRGLYTISVENTGSQNQAFIFGYFVRQYESIEPPTL